MQLHYSITQQQGRKQRPRFRWHDAMLAYVENKGHTTRLKRSSCAVLHTAEYQQEFTRRLQRRRHQIKRLATETEQQNSQIGAKDDNIFFVHLVQEDHQLNYAFWVNHHRIRKYPNGRDGMQPAAENWLTCGERILSDYRLWLSAAHCQGHTEMKPQCGHIWEITILVAMMDDDGDIVEQFGTPPSASSRASF